MDPQSKNLMNFLWELAPAAVYKLNAGIALPLNKRYKDSNLDFLSRVIGYIQPVRRGQVDGPRTLNITAAEWLNLRNVTRLLSQALDNTRLLPESLNRIRSIVRTLNKLGDDFDIHANEMRAIENGIATPVLPSLPMPALLKNKLGDGSFLLSLSVEENLGASALSKQGQGLRALSQETLAAAFSDAYEKTRMGRAKLLAEQKDNLQAAKIARVKSEEIALAIHEFAARIAKTLFPVVDEEPPKRRAVNASIPEDWNKLSQASFTLRS